MAEALPAADPRMQQAHCLAHVQDELSYVIESLLQDLTSDARHELSALLEWVRQAEALLPACRQKLTQSLELALQALQRDSRDRQACIDLVQVRRRIYNTRRVAYGHAVKYHGTPPLT